MVKLMILQSGEFIIIIIRQLLVYIIKHWTVFVAISNAFKITSRFRTIKLPMLLLKIRWTGKNESLWGTIPQTHTNTPVSH